MDANIINTWVKMVLRELVIIVMSFTHIGIPQILLLLGQAEKIIVRRVLLMNLLYDFIRSYHFRHEFEIVAAAAVVVVVVAAAAGVVVVVVVVVLLVVVVVVVVVEVVVYSCNRSNMFRYYIHCNCSKSYHC